jgi:hypothetical protein
MKGSVRAAHRMPCGARSTDCGQRPLRLALPADDRFVIRVSPHFRPRRRPAAKDPSDDETVTQRDAAAR